MSDEILIEEDAEHESRPATEEEIKAEFPNLLDDSELDAVSGGAERLTIQSNDFMFCPYCMSKHVVSTIKGKGRVGKYMHKRYWCPRKKLYFIHATNGYFTLEDERIPTNGII